jgi:hypothetical protein
MKRNKILLLILVLGIVSSFLSIQPLTGSAEEITEDYFDLYILQDCCAAVDETVWIGIDIYSYFSINKSINVTVFMYTPSGGEDLLYSQGTNISAWGYFYHDIYYTFRDTGQYEVKLIVIDETGKEWIRHCWWDVSYPWMDVWIEQDNYASVGEIGSMWLDIFSHYSSEKIVSVEVMLILPNETDIQIYFNDYVNISAFDSWYTEILYTFTEVGHYEVIAHVSDGYDVWKAFCWWEVYEGEYLALWIYQDYYRNVNETGLMDFVVQNRYSINKSLDVEIIILAPFGEEHLLPVTPIWLESGYTWTIEYEYLFTEVGSYEVILRVYDPMTTTEWIFTCWWEIGGGQPSGYELFIDQEYEAQVGDEKWMHFKAQSNFEHDMPEVLIKIYIEDPTGYEELIFEEVVAINAHGVWEIDLNYTFTQVGKYKVHFNLWDDIDTLWYTDCSWIVSEGGPYIEVDGPDYIGVNETFTIKAKVYAGSDESLHIKNITLAWLNGTIIDFVEPDQTFPVDSFFDVYFNLTIPIRGEYTVRIAADTNQGFLETKYSLKVGIDESEDTTTEPEDDTPTIPDLTPGFEGIFVLLALVSTIPIVRKYRR